MRSQKRVHHHLPPPCWMGEDVRPDIADLAGSKRLTEATCDFRLSRPLNGRPLHMCPPVDRHVGSSVAGIIVAGTGFITHLFGEIVNTSRLVNPALESFLVNLPEAFQKCVDTL